MTYAIQTQRLTKRFGERVAVDALDLQIEPGLCFALLGQNGAGKTTTIRMLCGLTTPDDGDAWLLGDSIVTQTTMAKQKLNLSPQETAVAPNLTVRENLELMARLYGADAREARRKADQMMSEMELSDRQKDRAKKLSGGLQRRLSIAMGLITQPQVLFLDEPTLGLDVRARRSLWKTLQQLKGHMTLILTTHYLEEAQALADRIAIMDKGLIVAQGSAEELMLQTGETSLEDVFLKLTEDEGEDL